MTQLFQLGVRWRRAAATVTMGDIAGRFTSDVTARLPSAALWSACSVQLDCDCYFLHLRRVNWSVTCFKTPFIVMLFDETFDFTAPSVSELFFHASDPAARLVPFQPMAHGFTL